VTTKLVSLRLYRTLSTNGLLALQGDLPTCGPGNQNYPPFFWVCVGRLTLLPFPPPPFFQISRADSPSKKRKGLNCTLSYKKSAHNSSPPNPGTTANYYYCLSHACKQKSQNKYGLSSALASISETPIQQTGQNSAPMLACPSRAAEPIHPTKLNGQLLICSSQTRDSFSTLLRRLTDCSPNGDP